MSFKKIKFTWATAKLLTFTFPFVKMKFYLEKFQAE